MDFHAVFHKMTSSFLDIFLILFFSAMTAVVLNFDHMTLRPTVPND